MNYNKSIKQASCGKIPNLMLLFKCYFPYLMKFKTLTLKSFQLCLLAVFNRSDNFELNEHFCQKFESSMEVQKIKFSDSPGHSILELYNTLVKIRFTTSKTKLDM